MRMTMLSTPKLKKVFRFLLLGCLVLGLVTMVAPPGQSQISPPQGIGESNQNNQSNQPPPGVERHGFLELTTVRSPLNNAPLLELASPTVYDRAADTTLVPVERRAEEVESQLRTAIYQFDEHKGVIVNVSKQNNMPVIVFKSDEHPQPFTLVTVTEKDAEHYGLPINILAAKWRYILYKEIQKGHETWSSEGQKKTYTKIAHTFFQLLASTAVIIVLKYAIYRYRKILLRRNQIIAETQEIELGSATSTDSSPFFSAIIGQRRRQFLQKLSQVLSLNRQLGFWKFIQWLLFWAILANWYYGFAYMVEQIPISETTILRDNMVERSLHLLGTCLLAGLAIRISRKIIDILQNYWKNDDSGDLDKFIPLGDIQRRSQRISTIAEALKSTVTVFIAIGAMLNALNIFGVPTGSVVAISSFIAIGLSFGSQSLVKDLLNGFFILVEDQYAINDVINVDFAAGKVENLNLRVTQLRSAGGELVTIPNGTITQVKNLTRSWSRANLSVNVAYDTDPVKAINVLRQVGEEMYNDPVWHEKILKTPEVLGIDNLSHEGMTITIWIETAPAQHWSVGRELRFRVRQTLAENGIEIGMPCQMYTTNAAPSSSPFGIISPASEI